MSKITKQPGSPAKLERQRAGLQLNIDRLLLKYNELKFFIDNYKKLNAEVKEKAKTLQELNGQIDEKTREVNLLLEREEKIRNRLAETNNQLLVVDSKIDESTKKQLGHVQEYQTILNKQKQEVVESQKQKDSLSKDIKELKIAKQEILKENGQLAKENKKIASLVKERAGLDAAVTSLRKTREEEEQKIADIREKMKGFQVDVDVIVRDLTSQQKAIVPYINDIIKFYKVQGKTPPPLFQDWKPKQIFYTQKEWKIISK